MLFQIADSLTERLHILPGKVLFGHAAVVFQRTHGGYQHDRIRLKPRHPALDIKELLRAQICAETGLRDDIVGHLERRPGGPDRITAMSYIGKRPSVHKCGRMFQSLDQIRLHGVLKQRSHGAHSLQVRRRHRLTLEIVGYDDPSQSLL